MTRLRFTVWYCDLDKEVILDLPDSGLDDTTLASISEKLERETFGGINLGPEWEKCWKFSYMGRSWRDHEKSLGELGYLPNAEFTILAMIWASPVTDTNVSTSALKLYFKSGTSSTSDFPAPAEASTSRQVDSVQSIDQPPTAVHSSPESRHSPQGSVSSMSSHLHQADGFDSRNSPDGTAASNSTVQTGSLEVNYSPHGSNSPGVGIGEGYSPGVENENPNLSNVSSSSSGSMVEQGEILQASENMRDNPNH